MEIAVKDLKVLSLFAGRKDIRYYLNCVRILGRHAMATDGHRLCVLRLDDDSGLDVLVPIDDIDAAIKCQAIIEKRLHRSLPSGKVVITATHVGSIEYKPIDGKYPDIGKAIPDDFTAMEGAALSLQGPYWADYYKAAKIIGSSRYVPVVARAANDNSAVLVSFCSDPRWFSICMQVNIDEQKKIPRVPAWLRKAFPRPAAEVKP